MGNDVDMNAPRYAIGELAELTGVSRRTVHWYVQCRIIDPPLGRGRGRHYDDDHVRQIREVKALQRLGVPLGAIRPVARSPGTAAAEQPAAAPSVTPVVRVRVADDVTVELGFGEVPITPGLVADLATAVGAVLDSHRRVEEEEGP